MMINRRRILTGLLATSAVLIAGKAGAMGILGRKKEQEGGAQESREAFPFHLSEQEWSARLSTEQYRVLREGGTERAWSSSLNDEKREGVYHCAGCDYRLFSSEHKFDSGTGWPSFYQPINEKAVGYTQDRKLFYTRTEVHCANCGGHQGHVFDDGPPPTGKRYCINGVALHFKPENA